MASQNQGMVVRGFSAKNKTDVYLPHREMKDCHTTVMLDVIECIVDIMRHELFLSYSGQAC